MWAGRKIISFILIILKVYDLDMIYRSIYFTVEMRINIIIFITVLSEFGKPFHD